MASLADRPGCPVNQSIQLRGRKPRHYPKDSVGVFLNGFGHNAKPNTTARSIIVEANHMQNGSKPVRFGVLATRIVRKLQAQHSSRTTGHSPTLKVIPGNPSQEPATNPPRRNRGFRDAPSKIMKVRKISSAR